MGRAQVQQSGRTPAHVTCLTPMSFRSLLPCTPPSDPLQQHLHALLALMQDFAATGSSSSSSSSSPPTATLAVCLEGASPLCSANATAKVRQPLRRDDTGGNATLWIYFPGKPVAR